MAVVDENTHPRISASPKLRIPVRGAAADNSRYLPGSTRLARQQRKVTLPTIVEIIP